MSELADKERRAIKILRMYRGDDPIEVSYSGGKDSDVILALTKMAEVLGASATTWRREIARIRKYFAKI
jgi:PP-loop superfamily ATP-utilizing enzyme